MEKRELVPVQQRHTQVVPSVGKAAPFRRGWLRLALVLIVAIGGAGSGLYWWLHLQPQLPPGIAFGNGRIEAQEIDIDTKFAGRIAEILGGVDRVVFGSDYGPIPYGIKEHVQIVEDVLPSAAERQQVFWKTSNRVFRLGLVDTDLVTRAA
jgi:hypothetical protein